MKPFLITVDTEGDNQWKTWKGEKTTTENARYVPRFQSLCEEFGFIPVYLVTHEMIEDPEFAAFLKRKTIEGKCEIGMHLHAWSSPPMFELERKFSGNPYVTEYPDEVMYEKMCALTEHIEQKLDVHPISHRAGRWASNDTMFSILDQLGYKIDCSVVSGWNGGKICGQTTDFGFDYSQMQKSAYWVTPNVLEVPMIVSKHRSFSGKRMRSKVKSLIKGSNIWLRPAMSTLDQMMWALDSGDTDYSMFMIHSTELMPGGSPYFATKEAVEEEFRVIEKLFNSATKNHIGQTLADYYISHNVNNSVEDKMI